ncbi:hypothetical protein P8452_75846 [Trifolium repens]|nr:ribosomal protein S4 [Trifolium repens]WJX94430.1 hypothetical protein P8452_75846 [Trifolium repens]
MHQQSEAAFPSFRRHPSTLAASGVPQSHSLFFHQKESRELNVGSELFLHRGFSHHFLEKILDHRGKLSNEYVRSLTPRAAAAVSRTNRRLTWVPM